MTEDEANVEEARRALADARVAQQRDAILIAKSEELVSNLRARRQRPDHIANHLRAIIQRGAA